MVLAHDLQECQKTKDIQISEDITFDTMLFSSNTLEGLKISGFVRPSPIQLHGIPMGKCGFDLLLEAKSGTGKTVVFTVIALEQLDLEKGLQTIVLAPTREIAAQICDVFRQIGCKYNGLCVEVVIGGLSINDDIDKFKENKVHIVVGSPGRLKHLINDGHIDISAVRLIVFDEADKLMEKSFLTDIKYIYLALPKEKQVIMSSATFPETCKEFINEFVHDAQHICPNSDCVLLGVVQKVTYVKHSTNTVIQTTKRFKELLKILTTKQFKQCLIFCNYRARVRELYKMLIKEKWPAEQLYGAQDQIDRLDALKTLQNYKCRILISTDLAARGIDASNVDLVIHFEPPIDWQTYLHRIGRAGRFGSYGMAIAILSEGLEIKNFMNLLSIANLTANVSQLWTEDESSKSDIVAKEVSDIQDCSQLNGSNNAYNTELWKIICDSEITPDDGIIEDFHELLNSFQETTSSTNGIKSFSDLYESFQSNHSPTDGTEYKCMKLSNFTGQSLTGVTKKVKDTVLEINNSPDKLSSNPNIRKEKIYSSNKLNINNNGSKEKPNSFTKKLSNNIHGSKEKRNESTEKFDNNVNISTEKENPIDKINRSTEKENPIDKINRSREKENPTDKINRRTEKENPIDKFNGMTENQYSSDTSAYNLNIKEKSNGSISKLNNNINKTKEKPTAKTNQSTIIYTEDNNSKGSYKPTCDSSHQNSHTNFKERRSAKIRSVMSNSSETSCSSSDQDITNLSKNSNRYNTHSKVNNIKLNRPPKSNLYQHCSKQSTSSNTNITIKQQSINSYNDWYKELQIRVKQIELAIYIDELSKL